MLSSTLTFLGNLADHKKLVGSWLVLLTFGFAQMGEKVYVQRTKELAVVETQLEQIIDQLKKMDAKLDVNGERLLSITVEQARVRAELATQRDITAAELAIIKARDAKIEADLEKHMREN